MGGARASRLATAGRIALAVLVFVFMQKYIVSGLTSGAIKG